MHGHHVKFLAIKTATVQLVKICSNITKNLLFFFMLQECSIELIRLNESTLWYEVLVNPEACCMKWASEADYIMPILTPKFLQEIHGKICGNNDSLGLLPTSPVLNKYMYNLARSQYTQNGCKNLKVRNYFQNL